MAIDCNKIYSEVNSAQSDYALKGDLKNEGTERLNDSYEKIIRYKLL